MQWMDCPADGPGMDRGRIAALGPKVHSTMAEIIAGSGSVLSPRGTVVSPRNWQSSYLISFPPAGKAVPRITPAGGREDEVKSIGPGKRLASHRTPRRVTAALCGCNCRHSVGNDRNWPDKLLSETVTRKQEKRSYSKKKAVTHDRYVLSRVGAGGTPCSSAQPTANQLCKRALLGSCKTSAVALRIF
jgi:hypothetical protein